MSETPTRKEALELLHEYNETEGLRKHALAVEGVMRYSARKRGHDEEFWGIVGLIHDLDYERYPQEHCAVTRRILEERDWPEEYIHAAVSHGWSICSDEKPEHEMEKVLFAIDELTGLVATTALVRPSKSVSDVKVSSVKKKWKDARFAAKVDRGIIQKGVDMLGEELSDIIAETIAGMQEVSNVIGL